ncbi:acyl carrier protein [Kitasatospora sp. MAA4]|uniref:acyl carrier protein n=1 Tax=Kitasatospora sp. MAA4 TaxID=3035093 RepID=UPI002474E83C|nr:acyl carrier protein [Kitasatospora sp. MAA4]
MRESAGQDEAVDLEGDILDTHFQELGYDSLALLETTSRIAREYGIAIADEDLDGAESPGALLQLVNQALTRV